MLTVLIILLVIFLFAGAPTFSGPTGWHGYGWGPSGIVGVVLLVLLILLLLGRL